MLKPVLDFVTGAGGLILDNVRRRAGNAQQQEMCNQNLKGQ